MASSSEAPAQNLGTSLDNVRRLTGSGLSHQSKPAKLLVAIEETLAASLPSAPFPPTAYFASLVSCLAKACSDDIAEGEDGEAPVESENMSEGALVPATLYLLSIVVPETPRQVVLSKLGPFLEDLLPLFPTATPHPPALRSLIQILISLLLIAPSSTLSSQPLLKKAWNFLLELNLDPRPKVRHLAQEGVRKVLTTPTPPKITPGSHPYLPRAREWAMGIFKEESKGGSSKSNGKKVKFAAGEDVEGKRAVWVVQGLRGWVSVWGDDQLAELCPLLLSLPPLPYLTPQIYALLSLLLSPPPVATAFTISTTPTHLSNLTTIIDSLLSSPPPATQTADQVEYTLALTSGLIKLARQDPLQTKSYLLRAWSTIWTSILTNSASKPDAQRQASQSLGPQGLLRYCVSDEMVIQAVQYKRQGSLEAGARKKQKTPFLTRIIEQISGAITSHALLMPHLLPILSSLISRLRLRVTQDAPGEVDATGTGTTAAEELILELVCEIGDLRLKRGFEEQEKADAVVGSAIEVMGVEAILKVLPLNVEPDADGVTPFPGRAHLLPLMRSRTTNDHLAFFTSYFVPLSERLFERKLAAENADKSGEAKVWEIVIGQIWDCLPGFLDQPRDLKEAFTTPFIRILSQLLYTNPLLRPSILRGLSVLVTSTKTLSKSAAPPADLRQSFGIDQETGKENMEYLKTLAADMLAVLFNVFSSVPREQRGMVGDVVSLWLSVMSEEDVTATYARVTDHLGKALTSPAPAQAGTTPLSHTMLDLLIILVPHLPVGDALKLFAATQTSTLLEHTDATVQKKSYRILARLIDSGKVAAALQGESVDTFVKRVEDVGPNVGPGAQRDRMFLLTALIPALPKSRLHLVPALLSEAVLGTKEVNEKARDAAFNLLVVMAQKMSQGGTIQHGLIGGEDDEEMSAPADATASIEEFITMTAAGLAGTTPHMISASITALSRLLFEFKDDISAGLMNELLSTIAVFVGSKNREIVKSALGFVKVAVVALPAATVEPHLPVLVPALLGWVHDHKNHFKSKTVHIFERMIRKFGYDAVYRRGGEGSQKKVLENIKKRKDRAKRKKDAKGDDGDEDMMDQEPKQSSGNAFEDVLYNSDSDLESDEDAPGPSKPAERPVKGMNRRDKRALGAAAAAYIRNDGDEPMDLLSRSIASGVSKSDPSAASRKRKPGQDAAHFKTDKTGKLVIPAENDEGGATDMAPAAANPDGAAYISTLTSVDGMQRMPDGSIKFNKDTKRGRELEMEMEGLEVEEAKGKGKKQRREVGKLGQEFKAKRAQGDVKKNGGPDPFSYVPIGQAARNGKGGGGAKVNLTNKKRGSRK